MWEFLQIDLRHLAIVTLSISIAGFGQAQTNGAAKADPANIAPTACTAAGAKLEVVGQPRTTKGHPCTLWDREDIAHYKEMLKTSTELQGQLAKLKAAMDKRIAQPLGVPEPQKDAKGEWMFPGFMEKYKKPGDKWGYGIVNGLHQRLCVDISNLGTLYALTGQEKYGEYCKKLLLAYAYGYPRYGTPSGKRDNMDRLGPQFLDDAMWLIKVCFGYDLIYNLPSLTAEERKLIENDLLKAVAMHFEMNKYLYQSPTNWSAICVTAALFAGYATDDQHLIDDGLYGLKGTKEKPTGGLLGLHFSDKCIGADGLWSEGAMSYQFMAAGVLVDAAEVLWHHGVDMYRYRDGILKLLFDSPLLFTYPDMTTPAFHDSHRGSLFGEYGIETYEYAYRRYRDPRYLPILTKTKKSLSVSVHAGPPSILYDLEAIKNPQITPAESVNFIGAGYGMLRVANESGINMLSLEYGPACSHGHPDKLAIDLYAQNDVLMPDPGVIFPYGDPKNIPWYWTTLGHCALVVDEKSQPYYHAGGNDVKEGQQLAQQTVFAAASTFGMQRAAMDASVTGAAQDRAVFLTPQYYADLFGAFSQTPHKYDLSWLIRGSIDSSLKFEPMEFQEPVPNGYNALSNVRRASAGDNAWSAIATQEGRTARFLAAGGAPTEVIIGEGHYEAPQRKDERVPVVIERRNQNSTLFGNAVDVSDVRDGYLKSVTQEGGAESGYGLLRLETTQGTDLCFAAYRPGTYKTGWLETDAQQAFVLMDGQDVRAMFLAGGTMLKVAGATIERGTSGLAYVERTKTGTYIVGNPSPTETTVTVTLSALSGSKAFTLDHKGQRGGEASVEYGSTPSSFVLKLKPSTKVEFAK